MHWHWYLHRQRHLNISKILRRKFSKIFKRAILKNICEKNSMMKSVFNKAAMIDFRPATLLKKSFQKGSFLVNTYKFSVLLEKGLM